VRRVAADRDSATQIISKKLANKEQYYLTENEAYEVLQCYGFPTLRRKLAESIKECPAAIDEIGFPAVMKICSPDIIHKADAGGIVLKIDSLDMAKQAYEQILKNAKKIQGQRSHRRHTGGENGQAGRRVILGMARDPKFGPVCMFGLGGTFVEVLKDVTFRLAPMWEISAEIMIESIKKLPGATGHPQHTAFRYRRPERLHTETLQLVSDNPEIAEMDINPLLVYPEGPGLRRRRRKNDAQKSRRR